MARSIEDINERSVEGKAIVLTAQGVFVHGSKLWRQVIYLSVICIILSQNG